MIRTNQTESEGDIELVDYNLVCSLYNVVIIGNYNQANNEFVEWAGVLEVTWEAETVLIY